MDVVFRTSGKWVNKWMSFKDVNGNVHPAGKYWEYGYQEGVGFLLSVSPEASVDEKFFVESFGLPIGLNLDFSKVWGWLILLLAVVIGYLVLKRK